MKISCFVDFNTANIKGCVKFNLRSFKALNTVQIGGPLYEQTEKIYRKISGFVDLIEVDALGYEKILSEGLKEPL